MYDPWAAIWKYTKISLQKTLFNLKLKVKIPKGREVWKKTRSISSMLDKLSASTMKCFSVKCCLRHIWNQLSRTIKDALLDIRMGNIINCYFIESNQSCLRMIAITGRKRHIKNPVENLQCSFLAKIINGVSQLVILTKKFHGRCSTRFQICL